MLGIYRQIYIFFLDLFHFILQFLPYFILYHKTELMPENSIFVFKGQTMLLNWGLRLQIYMNNYQYLEYVSQKYKSKVFLFLFEQTHPKWLFYWAHTNSLIFWLVITSNNQCFHIAVKSHSHKLYIQILYIYIINHIVWRNRWAWHA